MDVEFSDEVCGRRVVVVVLAGQAVRLKKYARLSGQARFIRKRRDDETMRGVEQHA